MTADTPIVTSLRAGLRLASRVGSTNVVVLEVGAATAWPDCAGSPMKVGAIIGCGQQDKPAEEFDVRAGRVYVDETTRLRVMCTRSGIGPLTVEGRTLVAAPTTGFAAHPAVRSACDQLC